MKTPPFEKPIEQMVDELLLEDRITEADADSILDFHAFLEVAKHGDDGRLEIPAEWFPYATGKGPAPRSAAK